jgi:uncharacterized repeat protein (TIGR03803 family)
MQSAKPTASPSAGPTATPSPKPTATPSPKPTATPSPKPTATPSPKPTATPSPTPNPDPDYKVLYNFAAGETAIGGVTALNGSLYGSFGKSGGGGVYEVNASGVERVVNESIAPFGGLTALNGVLYGAGYNSATIGVFSLTPSGSGNVFLSFANFADFNPVGALISVDGELYGVFSGYPMYASDCSCNWGLAYDTNPSGQGGVLYRFTGGTNGEYPKAGLVYSNGDLYGTTSCYDDYLDRYDCGGTVFSLTPAGAETTLYVFKGGSDGLGPFASLISLHGLLYGTTVTGGRGHGTVFAISPSGVEHVVYRFKGTPDGSDPMANLTAVGDALYGTTVGGGANGLGTIFRVSTTGVEEVVHSFSRADGTHPTSGLLYRNGLLYGTTPSGGAGSGTVFERKIVGP